MKRAKFTTALVLVLTSSAISATEFRVTNYNVGSKTASGHPVKEYLCAADWKCYPPGTIIQLDTGERLIVADRGPKVKGKNHIDRYNPFPKSRFYPQRSKGVVVSRGGYYKNPHKDVERAFKIKKELDRKAKLNAKQSSNSGIRNSRANNSLRVSQKDKPKQHNNCIKKNTSNSKHRTSLSSQKCVDRKPVERTKPKLQN